MTYLYYTEYTEYYYLLIIDNEMKWLLLYLLLFN